MSSLPVKTAREEIEEVVKGSVNIEKQLERDVDQMCTLLSVLDAGRFSRVDMTTRLESQRKKFIEVYWILKLHLLFHLGSRIAVEHKNLKELGSSLGLTNADLDRLPGKGHAVDPGSKILEILSDLVEDHGLGQRGSQTHANDVMFRAKYLFCGLRSNNRFRPKVLAVVTDHDRWYVGSSISVSPFLRPLCLHRRICRFKGNLRKAVIFDESLVTADPKDWSSSAFQKKGYTAEKDPCLNCKRMFKNLKGFILNDDHSAKVSSTFLGACAEYVPVNELLTPDEEASSEHDARIHSALKASVDRCAMLFEGYREIVDECDKAHGGNDDERIKRAYRKVREKIHIFGYKPQCKFEN